MGNMKTPGVYIVEKSAFPNSVVEVSTAIPAFIGITEKAENGNDSLKNKPWKISSMTEYMKYFGGGPEQVFEMSVVQEADVKGFYTISGKEGKLQVVKPKNKYTLYYHLIMFFAHGGGTCYILSVGTYRDKDMVDKGKVKEALTALEKEQEITMIVVPEAVNNAEDCASIQTQMLAHCAKMQNRFAIFDVQPKEKDNETMDEQVSKFRTNIGANFLSYGATYYPWLETSVLGDKDITARVLSWKQDDTATLEKFFGKDSQLGSYVMKCLDQIKNGKKIVKQPEVDPETNEPKKDENGDIVMKETEEPFSADDKQKIADELHSALSQNWPDYQLLVKRVKEYLNLLPPSAAMAGIYTMVDNTRGVWKAPANVSVNYVNSPSEIIDNTAQENLNVPMNGKAINAIRAFIGEGIKVWGARTLDGNSLDWRYVNVRRTMLFLEESVKNAARAYVFEPNDANTWLNMRCMIENFLYGIWKRGGLAGAVPEDAYCVHVGLGDTMTPEDILEGIMRITVLVAISHPAEFIEIAFQQQMQKS